jgi:hypothetical protein
LLHGGIAARNPSPRRTCWDEDLPSLALGTMPEIIMATIVMNTLDEVTSAERTFGLSVLPQELWVPSYGLPGVPFFQFRRSNLLESLNWISEDETTHVKGSRALSVHLNVRFSGIFFYQDDRDPDVPLVRNYNIENFHVTARPKEVQDLIKARGGSVDTSLAFHKGANSKAWSHGSKQTEKTREALRFLNLAHARELDTYIRDVDRLFRNFKNALLSTYPMSEVLFM